MSVLCRLNPYGDGVMYGKLARVLFILLIMHSCTTGMRFCVTLDALEHGASSFEVGAMLASVALFPAFGAIAAGRWLDRSGPRPSLALAIFCAASAGAATLIFPTKTAGLWPLFSACILVGTAFMLTNTVVQRLTGDVSTNETRALAFTLLSIVTALSGLLTPIITGYMIEHFGFASFYCWVAGAPIFVGLMCLLPFMRHVLPAGGNGARKAAGTHPQKVMDFFRDPPLRAVLFCSVVVSVAWEVGNLLIPVFCASVKLSPSDIGWVLGSFSAASFAVRLLMPYLMRHMREWIMIALTLLISALAFVLFPFFESQLPLMACAFLLGLGLGASLPNMMSLVYRLAPKGRTGEAIGLRLMLINSSKATFPVAMGALGAVIGAGASLWGLAIFVFLGFLFAMRSAPTVIGAVAGSHTEH